MSKTANPHIGKRLRQVRQHRDISQGRLARAIGVSVGTIQNYERGRAQITADRLEHLARALQCQPADLLMPLQSPLPKYRYSRLRKDVPGELGRGDPLDHLAAIWEEMRKELLAETGIDIGDQPVRDWIEAIRERMGTGEAAPSAARDRIRKRFEAYHALKMLK